VWETIAGTLDKFHFLYYPESTAIDDAVHPSGYNLIWSVCVCVFLCNNLKILSFQNPPAINIFLKITILKKVQQQGRMTKGETFSLQLPISWCLTIVRHFVSIFSSQFVPLEKSYKTTKQI